MEKLKKIPENYKKNGYEYEILRRKGDKALYEQAKNNKVYGYEVVKVRKAKVRGFLKKSKAYEGYTHYEKLPSNEEFGTYGQSYEEKDSVRRD